VIIKSNYPVGKIVKKQSEGVRFLALKLQCHIVKNTYRLLFRRFCPHGKW